MPQYDGDKDQNPPKEQNGQQEDLERVGDYNLGEDLINAGEGYNPVEDETL